MDTRKFLTVRTIRQWNMLLGKVVNSPLLEVLKQRLVRHFFEML